MGIQDRDYYRDGSHGFLDIWGHSAVVWIIVLNSVILFAEYLTGSPWQSPLVKIGEFSYDGILSGEVWRLITSVFLHAGLLHLFFNMLVLYWAGSQVEDIYGSREFLAFYLIAGVFANLVTLAAQLLELWPAGFGIGASGAVTAVLVVFACYYPHQQVRLYFILPMPVWLLVVLFVALDILGAFGVGRQGIGVFAHLGGALFGFLYYKTGFRFRGLFGRGLPRSARRKRPSLRVVPAPMPEDDTDTPAPVGAAVENTTHPQEAADEQFEARVDRVLEKVSRHGQESLTPAERELLFKASEMYKRRRK